MSVTRLDTLFERLAFNKVESVVRTPPDFSNTFLDLPIKPKGEMHKRFNIMPRLANNTVEKIARGAASGNRDDMLTISMMYSVGLGVEKSDRLSTTWASMSLVEGDPEISFKEAVVRLRDTVKALPKDGWSYPSILDRMYTECIHDHKRATPSKVTTKGSYTLSPIVSGLRVFLIYRIEGAKCYLYNARVGGLNGENIALDAISRLDIPIEFGEIRNKSTIPDYCDRMSDYIRAPLKAFVVTGTIAVPSELKSAVKQAHPECRSTKELFASYQSTLEEDRIKYIPHECYGSLKLSYDSLRQELKDIKSGDKLIEFKSQWSKVKRKFDSAKKAKDKKRSLEAANTLTSMREIGTQLTDGSKEKAVRTKLEQLQLELHASKAVEDQHREAYKAKYLERVFKIVASDIYAYDEKGYYPFPLARHLHTHLQGLGFSSFNHPMLDDYKTLTKKSGVMMTDKSFDHAVKKFQSAYPSFKVVGISAKQDDSVDEPLVYLLSK
jgi:hypothetical protein